MWIEKVLASAFGPLEDAELELGPGMNVVWGPNESGKSSWHAAIFAALCGVRRAPGMPRSEDSEFADRYRPWHADRWLVGTVVQLADGRRLELHQDLDGRVDSRITDLETGRDVSADHMHDGAPDAATLLGLTRDLMPSTVFVRQADVLRVLQSAEALQSDLQRAAATGGGAATAQQAIRLIEAFRSERVGSPVQHSTGPLRAAMSREEENRRELHAARTAQRAYLELLQAADRAREEAELAEQRLAGGHARDAWGRLRRMEARLAQAEALDRELAAREQTETPADREVVERVRNALAAFRNLRASSEVTEGRSAAEIEAEVDALPDPPAGDVEVHESVAAAWEEWRARLAALDAVRLDEVEAPPVPEARGFRAEELRRFAAELEAPLPELDPTLAGRLEQARARAASSGRRRRFAGVAGLLLLVSGAAILGVAWSAGEALAPDRLYPAVALGVAGALALAMAALGRSASARMQALRVEAQLAAQQEAQRQGQNRRDRATERVRRLGLPDSADALHALARQMEDAEGQLERRRHWMDRVARRGLAARTAEAALEAALGLRGVVADVDSEGDTERLYATYEESCRRRVAESAQASRRASLLAELGARRALERTYESEVELRRQTEDWLMEACGLAGLVATGPEAAKEDLVRWLSRQVVLQMEEQMLQEGRAKLDGLLEGRTLRHLRDELERLRSELPFIPGEADPGGDGSGESEPIEDLKHLEARARDARKRALELAGELADREKTPPSVVEAEEEHENALRELERIRALDHTLEQTGVFLERARDGVQRLIAPRIQQSLGSWLPRITNGRYREVMVDPESLEVSVRTQQGEWRSAARLSHGTSEQVYLLLRMALVDFLVASGEPAPLILDDVTVQSDASRTEALLELLAERSAERQVILFSQERQIVEWARGRLGGGRGALIELTPATAVPQMPDAPPAAERSALAEP